MTARRPAVAALVAVAVLAAVLVARAGDHRRTVVATFDGARGLVAGADVRVGGLRVGRVEDVALDARAFPVVRMSVDRDLDLRRGTRAAVRLASVSGELNRYVALTTGGGAPLPAGTVRLTRARTSSPVEVDQAVAALDPRTRADLRAALHGLGDALDGRGPQVAHTLRRSAAALRQTALAARDVSGDGAALRTLVASSRRITAALTAGRPARVADLASDVAGLLRTTAARGGDVRTAIAALPPALRATRGALAEVRAATPDLRGLVRDAAPGLHTLVPASGELRAALTRGGPALRQAAALTATAPADLRAATPLLDDARATAAALTPVARRAGPMLDQLRVRLPDFFSFFSGWADFTSNYDANGHGARVGLVFPPAPTTTLDPSGDSAGQLAAPFLRTPGSLAGEPWKDYADSFVAGGTAAADVAPKGGAK